jgi:hypothetical protein
MNSKERRQQLAECSVLHCGVEGVDRRVRRKIIQYRFLHNKAAKAKIKKEKDKERIESKFATTKW